VGAIVRGGPAQLTKEDRAPTFGGTTRSCATRSPSTAPSTGPCSQFATARARQRPCRHGQRGRIPGPPPMRLEKTLERGRRPSRSTSPRRAGGDRFNPCESASNPLRLRLDVLQPSLQPFANGRERLRRAIRTSPFKGGQALGQKSEQLEQRDARVRDVVVRPLRRMYGNPGQQRISELLKAADVRFRCRLRHRCDSSTQSLAQAPARPRPGPRATSATS
jgi:hypothetical protein